MIVLGALLQIYVALLEFIFCLFRPSLWRFYVFFQIEYFFFSPYYLAGRHTEGDEVYGFTPMFTARRILKQAAKLLKKPMKSLSFLDLGCGDGRFVLLARLLFRIRATGVELNEKFLKKSRMLRYALGLKETEFIPADMLEFSVEDYDIIYIAWTTFSDKTVKKMVTKLAKDVKPGGMVITLSFPVDHKKFKVISRQKGLFSWGRNQVYFQVKSE